MMAFISCFESLFICVILCHFPLWTIVFCICHIVSEAIHPCLYQTFAPCPPPSLALIDCSRWTCLQSNVCWPGILDPTVGAIWSKITNQLTTINILLSPIDLHWLVVTIDTDLCVNSVQCTVAGYLLFKMCAFASFSSISHWWKHASGPWLFLYQNPGHKRSSGAVSLHTAVRGVTVPVSQMTFACWESVECVSETTQGWDKRYVVMNLDMDWTFIVCKALVHFSFGQIPVDPVSSAGLL